MVNKCLVFVCGMLVVASALARNADASVSMSPSNSNTVYTTTEVLVQTTDGIMVSSVLDTEESSLKASTSLQPFTPESSSTFTPLLYYTTTPVTTEPSPSDLPTFTPEPSSPFTPLLYLATATVTTEADQSVPFPDTQVPSATVYSLSTNITNTSQVAKNTSYNLSLTPFSLMPSMLLSAFPSSVPSVTSLLPTLGKTTEVLNVTRLNTHLATMVSGAVESVTASVSMSSPLLTMSSSSITTTTTTTATTTTASPTTTTTLPLSSSSTTKSRSLTFSPSPSPLSSSSLTPPQTSLSTVSSSSTSTSTLSTTPLWSSPIPSSTTLGGGFGITSSSDMEYRSTPSHFLRSKLIASDKTLMRPSSATTLTGFASSVTAGAGSPKKYQCTVRLDRSWNSDLEYSYTPAFRSLAAEVEQEVLRNLEDLDEKKMYVQVTGFRPGSVYSDLLIILEASSTITDAQITDHLKRKGGSGNLTFDEVEVMPFKAPKPTETPEDGIALWIIVAIVTGTVIFILLVVMVVLVIKITGLRRRLNRSKSYRSFVSDNDVSFYTMESRQKGLAESDEFVLAEASPIMHHEGGKFRTFDASGINEGYRLSERNENEHDNASQVGEVDTENIGPSEPDNCANGPATYGIEQPNGFSATNPQHESAKQMIDDDSRDGVVV